MTGSLCILSEHTQKKRPVALSGRVVFAMESQQELELLMRPSRSYKS